jgi:beta-glucanase (GH16 family)
MFGNRKAAHHTAHSQLTVSNKRHGENNTFVEKLNVKKWHVYGIEWTPTYITWTVDGKPVGTYYKSKNERLLKQGQWTFDSPCYIVLNQSVGDGSYSHMVPNCKTTYETQFDWIRVYQKKKGKTTKEIKESADFNLVF